MRFSVPGQQSIHPLWAAGGGSCWVLSRERARTSSCPMGRAGPARCPGHPPRSLGDFSSTEAGALAQILHSRQAWTLAFGKAPLGVFCGPPELGTGTSILPISTVAALRPPPLSHMPAITWLIGPTSGILGILSPKMTRKSVQPKNNCSQLEQGWQSDRPSKPQPQVLLGAGMCWGQVPWTPPPGRAPCLWSDQMKPR